MKTTYSVADARDDFAEVINRVAYSGEMITIEKYGKPVVVLSPVKVERPSTDMVKKYAGIWAGEKWADKIGKPSRNLNRKDYWA
ncbi:MAG: type II toxin-antitoxin system prevent-host-death family antitoxin [Patescibacteria group bacterium]